MSGALTTAEQPPFHTDNIAGHPGSTAAGIGVIAVTVQQALANGVPTSGWGWAVFALQIAGSAAAVLGK
jgi:hypothetical protein